MITGNAWRTCAGQGASSSPYRATVAPEQAGTHENYSAWRRGATAPDSSRPRNRMRTWVCQGTQPGDRTCKGDSQPRALACMAASPLWPWGAPLTPSGLVPWLGWLVVSVLVSVASASGGVRGCPLTCGSACGLLRWADGGSCRTYVDQGRTSRNA